MGMRQEAKQFLKVFENILPILREDTRIKYVFFDKEHDPDSYIRAFGKEAFDDLLKHGLPLSQFFLNRVKEVDDLTTIEGRCSIRSKIYW